MQEPAARHQEATPAGTRPQKEAHHQPPKEGERACSAPPDQRHLQGTQRGGTNPNPPQKGELRRSVLRVALPSSAKPERNKKHTHTHAQLAPNDTQMSQKGAQRTAKTILKVVPVKGVFRTLTGTARFDLFQFPVHRCSRRLRVVCTNAGLTRAPPRDSWVDTHCLR